MEETDPLFALDNSNVALNSGTNSSDLSDTDSLANKLKVQPRELKKRKIVHFDPSRSFEKAKSTSEYLKTENKQWKDVALLFNVYEGDQGIEYEIEKKKELLELTRFFESSETPGVSENDSEDDEIPYAFFAKQRQNNIKPSPMAVQNKISTSTESSDGVSKLRLTSLMRLDSRPGFRRTKSFMCSTNLSSSVSTANKKKDKLELAFQGIMTNASSTNVCSEAKSTATVEVVESVNSKAKNDENDFWGDVEF